MRDEREERVERGEDPRTAWSCVVPSLPAVDKLNQNVTNSLPLSHFLAAGTMEPDL